MRTFKPETLGKCAKTAFMLIFQPEQPRKCADAPYFGRILAKYVKNWSICALLSLKPLENAQKSYLCSFFSWKSHENEQTLHILEES
jgi:hypothetical protein